MDHITMVEIEDAPRPQAAAVPAEREDAPAESRSEERLSDADDDRDGAVVRDAAVRPAPRAESHHQTEEGGEGAAARRRVQEGRLLRRRRFGRRHGRGGEPERAASTGAAGSFDLIVRDWNGMSYRLMNNNLEKDIDASKSKHVVKPNKIIIKMGKVKGEYGYDSWQQLTAKKAKKRDASGRAAKDDNPAAGIMDLMKDMYDEGDDNMKKMIGETMYKQRMGKLNPNDPMGGMDDMMGDMGGMMGM